MLLFQALLTLIAVYAVYAWRHPIPDTGGTLYHPHLLLKISCVFLVPLTLAAWIRPSWIWIGFALPFALGVLVWRNSRIRFGKDGFTATGWTGLQKTCTYGEVTRAVGGAHRWILVGPRAWYISPFARSRATFLNLLDMGWRRAHQGKPLPGLQPASVDVHSAVAHLCATVMVFLLLSALSVYVCIANTEPILPDPGRTDRMLLVGASLNDSGDNLYLDFDTGYRYVIRRTEGTERLLEEDAADRWYTVQARYVKRHRSRTGHYSVDALTGPEGEPLLTLEETNARRQAQLPQNAAIMCGLTLTVTLMAASAGIQGRKPARRR